MQLKWDLGTKELLPLLYFALFNNTIIIDQGRIISKSGLFSKGLRFRAFVTIYLKMESST